MDKRTMTYTNYNGEKITEDFYFNLTKAEILEMEMTTQGGMAEYIKSVVNAKNTSEIVKIFKELILKAYGKKSADGRRFIKSDELREEFSQTEAYSDLFMILATDAEEAAKFVNAITPSDVNVDAETALKAVAPDA